MTTRARFVADPPDAVWHGTSGGYTNHHCRCKPCTDAMSQSLARSRARRHAGPTPDHVHGTTNGYGNYGCRCDRCRAAWVEADKQRRKARKRRMAEAG